jgi:hypothetical protein
VHNALALANLATRGKDAVKVPGITYRKIEITWRKIKVTVRKIKVT